MKKRIAFFLAVLMSVSLLPVNAAEGTQIAGIGIEWNPRAALQTTPPSVWVTPSAVVVLPRRTRVHSPRGTRGTQQRPANAPAAAVTATATIEGVTAPIGREGSIASVELGTRDIRSIVSNAEGGSVSFDFSGLEGFSYVREARVPRLALQRFADAGLAVEIILPRGTVELSADAISEITGHGFNANITVALSAAPAGLLNSRQRNAVQGDAVYMFSVLSGRTAIEDFASPVTVTLGTSGQVFALEASGDLTRLTGAGPFELNGSAVVVVR